MDGSVKEQSVCLTQITVMVVRLVEVEKHIVMVSHEFVKDRAGGRLRFVVRLEHDFTEYALDLSFRESLGSSS